MSKTDKTNPHRVKVSYRPEYLVETHDHRFGECTLGPRPGAGDEQISMTDWQRGRCCWSASDLFWGMGVSRCACVRCGDQAGRKAKARRQRQDGSRQARNWTNE